MRPDPEKRQNFRRGTPRQERLEAIERRLEAMLEAAKLVQPALDEFYATLSSEQKAPFNTLQQVASP